MPGNVLQHDDGIIHHKAGGNGQRHQSQVVDGKAHQIHETKSTHQRQRHRDTGDDGGRNAAQEGKGHQHHQPNGEQQLMLYVTHRGADALGTIGQHQYIHRCRQGSGQLRQQCLHPIRHLNHVGPGLALHVEQHRRLGIGPGSQETVFGAVDNGGDIAEAQRRPVLPGEDQIPVVLYRADLIVGIQHGGAVRAIKAALGLVGVGRGNGRTHVVQTQAVVSQYRRVGLYPQRRTLATGQADHADPGQLGQFLRHAGIHQIMHLRQRHGIRGNGQSQNGRIRRVDLAVDRRCGQIIGQQAVRGIDRRLHLLFGNPQIHLKGKLQGDYRSAGGTGGGHLFEPGNLPQMPLQWRGNGPCGDLGTSPGLEGEYLDDRVIHLRQRRHRQHAPGDDTGDEKRQHQQRGSHRTQNKRPRQTIHGP